jgi:hypothetical protein
VDVARLDAPLAADALADRALARWGSDITLNCQMLAGLVLWERHTLQPLAQELFGSKVALVRHYRTYSCRNVNNAAHVVAASMRPPTPWTLPTSFSPMVRR